MPRRLIVNADDLGFAPGITRGIIRAHQQGIVTSTSVMVNMPAAPEAIRMVQRDTPTMGLGLHLTMTVGLPVSQVDKIPDLVDVDCRFPNKTELATNLPTIDMSQVELELRAQIIRFTQLAGHAPDHLDSHHHITYLSPPMTVLMMQLARELGVPVRKPLATNPEISVTYLLELGAARNQAAAEEMVMVLSRLVGKAGVPTPDYFVTDFFAQRTTLGDLLNALVDLPEGITELMCHPGEVDAELRATSGYTDYRAAELEALMHPSVCEVIQAEEIELITFGALVTDG